MSPGLVAPNPPGHLCRSDAALASEPMHLLSVWYLNGNALWLASRGHVLRLPPANSPCFKVRDGRWVTGPGLSDESSYAPAFCVMYDWLLARGWGHVAVPMKGPGA